MTATILIDTRLCMGSKSYLLRIGLVYFILTAYNLTSIMLAAILQINTQFFFSV
jgi:hypothetical protein